MSTASRHLPAYTSDAAVLKQLSACMCVWAMLEGGCGHHVLHLWTKLLTNLHWFRLRGSEKLVSHRCVTPHFVAALPGTLHPAGP